MRYFKVHFSVNAFSLICTLTMLQYEKEEASEAKLNLVEESETEVHSTATRRKGWRNKFRFGRNRARTNENSQTVSV